MGDWESRGAPGGRLCELRRLGRAAVNAGRIIVGDWLSRYGHVYRSRLTGHAPGAAWCSVPDWAEYIVVYWSTEPHVLDFISPYSENSSTTSTYPTQSWMHPRRIWSSTNLSIWWKPLEKTIVAAILRRVSFYPSRSWLSSKLILLLYKFIDCFMKRNGYLYPPRQILVRFNPCLVTWLCQRQYHKADFFRA